MAQKVIQKKKQRYTISQAVRHAVYTWQEWRCKRARQYLLTHDADWRGAYVSNELVAQRNALYDKGVRPDDERIPDRWDVDLALPPMAWPHKDHLAFLKQDHTEDQKPR